MQLSLMLLLNDLDEKTTHMEYLLSSHKRKLFDLIVHKNFEQCEKEIKKNNYKIFKCIGKKGDAFLFNSTGIHRAYYILGTTRNVFHLNFTNGHNLFNYKNVDNLNLNFIDNENFEVINRKSNKTIFYNDKKKGDSYQYFTFQR